MGKKALFLNCRLEVRLGTDKGINVMDNNSKEYFVSIIKEENYVIKIKANTKDEALKIVESGQYPLDREFYIDTLKTRIEFSF